MLPLILAAQDIHFSQFFRTPSTLNPALNGVFDGGYRVMGIYRTQWGSISKPFETINLAGDANSFMNVRNLGVGANMFYDRAGDGNLGTFNLNISASYSFHFGSLRNHSIAPGLQFGLMSRQLDRDQLKFEQNGAVNDQSLNANRSYFTLNGGFLYRYQPKRGNELKIGVSWHNINQPDVGFYNEDELLYVRTNYHATYRFEITTKWSLEPGMLYRHQSSNKEWLAGLNGIYILENSSMEYTALHAGVWTRVEDAAFIFLGVDWQKLSIGLSYDFNISGLSAVTQNRGGFEISVMYIFDRGLPKRKFYKTCPEYL
jgi:type IX secretion system PorP/SprF family membrane protein